MSGRSCRFFTLALLIGMASSSVASAVPVNSWDAAQLPETKGTVRQYTLTPRGDVDGFILTDGTEVKVPKHLSAQLVYAIRPGDAVTVRGLKAFALPLIDAATITNDATGAVVIDNGPPGPDRGGLVTTITGKVLATLHGPRGDVNGAILENGTILRLGPREAASVSALLQPGQSLAARGVSTTTLLGTVMEVEAIGASPDQLVEVGPGGPGRERGQDPVIGVRLRLHLRHLVEPCACETEEEKKKPALPAERGCQHCRRLA